MGVRFYSNNAPTWWPFHVVTVNSESLPGKAESVIVDNNAFTFYRRGEFPQLDQWLARIARVARRLEGKASEIIVVLPDRPLDPATTQLWALRSRWLCREHKCMAVMHYACADVEELQHTFESYVYQLDVDLYALPLKLPLSKRYSVSARRTAVDEKLQHRVVEVASMVVGRDKLHLMAPATSTVLSMWKLARSFDTTAWTRASSQTLKRLLGTISARDWRERELMFATYIAKLVRAGVKVEGAELALEFLTTDVGWPKLNYIRRGVAYNSKIDIVNWLQTVSVRG